jgi:endo-1,4-beta-D-glucanase Y
MANKIIFLLVLCIFSAYSAVNYPYPQQKSYGSGTINTTVSDASTKLKSKFNSFLSTHYEENPAKTLARIKFDDTRYTVSEGIGYGMIMMVYFSDNTKNYKDEFDRLWAYYNNFLNANKLMHWKIDGFSSVNQQNAATDAEFDVAVALVMAHYQFGGQQYLTDAQSLISKIRQYEIDPNNLHRPGDGWNDKRNPSYVSPAAFEIFKEIETNQVAKWNDIISANYTLLKSNQNQSSVKLPSDWCNDNGTVNGPNEFGYDASRAPWRPTGF